MKVTEDVVRLTKNDEKVVMMAEYLVNVRDDEEDVVMMRDGRRHCYEGG